MWPRLVNTPFAEPYSFERGMSLFAAFAARNLCVGAQHFRHLPPDSANRIEGSTRFLQNNPNLRSTNGLQSGLSGV